MPIIANKPEGGDFITVEPGTYVARCYSMIEVGTIEVEWQGQKKKQKKVIVGWELPTETAIFDEAKGPQPFVVSKRYTLSMHPKSALRKDLESWRGQGYADAEAEKVDITKLIGQPCLLTVIQKSRPDDTSKTYTSVENVAKLMRGQDCPDQVNPTRILSYDKWDEKIFNSLSDYTKDQIRSSDEFKRMQEPSQIRIEDQSPDSDELSDLPF